MLTEVDKLRLCEIARIAAVKAGEYIQTQFSQQPQVLRKEGGSSIASQLVTDVDIKAQGLILSCLQPTIEQYNLGLLTEETADNHSRIEKDYFWCIDPMDGTLAFTEQRSGYAVSIALLNKKGEPILGVVYLPDEKDCYTAIRGLGLRLNHQPYVAKGRKDSGTLAWYMDSSMLNTDYYKKVGLALAAWSHSQGLALEQHSGFGAVSNAIAVMHSANGVYFKFPKQEKGGGSIWDYAATSLFLQELGGYVSDINGQALDLNNEHTTFMNQTGIVYAKQQAVATFLMEINQSIQNGS